MVKILLSLIISTYGLSGKNSFSIDIKPKEKQDEVLFKGPVDKGGFCGLVIKTSEINDEIVALMGLRGGVIFNRTFGIGGGIYGMVNGMDVQTNYPMRNFNMDFAYGGIILELIFGSRKLIHFGTNTLIGGGLVEYRLSNYEEPWYEDCFFTLEPSVEMTLNVTRIFRIDIGGSYRYIYGTELDGINDRGLSGVGGHITFKFGKF
uniref:Outer membrane protein beta-barrel domain-containing protein n=1 Tax=candidate division WOR-3 bacterium TaxID=2052148 RepID=A0A7C4XDN1_UNCW3